MINLENTSGLPVEVGENYKLKFKPPLTETEPAVRKFSEMVPLLMDSTARPNPATEDMYYMYRSVNLPEDKEKLNLAGLRYDITVIPPVMIGRELNKTAGHYHPRKPGTQFAFPEMYEVLHGRALFLIQKMDSEYKNLISFYGIEATAGDKVIYPPNYGHVIVNIGKDALITANWVAADFNSEYEPIKSRRGMAYYAVADDEKPYTLIKNEQYQGHPPVRMLMMADKIDRSFLFRPNEPMYITGTNNPKLLEFLTHPEKYAVELSTVTS